MIDSTVYDIIPPLVPDDEVFLPIDFVISEHFWSLIDIKGESIARVYGKPTLSRSKKWGIVWRVDFRWADELKDNNLINRVMCWRCDNGEEGVVLAGHQAIPPLWQN